MLVNFRNLPESAKERVVSGDETIERELVAAQIDEWSDESHIPLAHVIHILGRGGEIEPQIAAILFENAICAANFSPESLACVPDLPWEVPVKEFETRKDFRNICTFTIDPSTAIDLDDALSIEEIVSDEVFRIGVHIADASYFVLPETALDTEAQIRSTSVYILQHKIPMLPPQLSEELGSLLPGKDRLALSVTWDIGRSGNIVARWIGRSIIRSCCKLSYDIVQEIIAGSLDANQLNSSTSPIPQLYCLFKWEDIFRSLRSLYEVSMSLRRNRFKDGALWLESSKLGFLFDEFGTPYDSFLRERKESHSLVEEFMLLANISVVEVISAAFPDCALLHRHPEPNLRKLRDFEAFCSRYGFELDTSSSGQLHLSLSKIREKLKDDPMLYDILVSYASKPMQPASYFCTGDLRGRENEWAHYALSVPLYTHFTSPLRRYPDILVHRTLCATLDAEGTYLNQRQINNSGAYGSELVNGAQVHHLLHAMEAAAAGATATATATADGSSKPRRSSSRQCSICNERKAALKRPKTLEQICRECFYVVFEEEIHKAIVDSHLFRPGERVAIGASGGKDSTVLAYVLSHLNRRHNYGLDLFLLSVDEGITGYRDDSLETVKRNEVQYGLPLKIVSYKDLYGWTMDEIVKAIGMKNNCTFCGVFRRQALDRGAALMKADKIVTGHNADDIAETVILNILRGDIARLSRCTLITTGEDGPIPRCKPFKYTYEKEIVMYAYFKKLDYFSTECIYSPNAYRGFAREFIKDLEKIRPRAILDIITSGENFRISTSTKMPEQGTCERCGYISSQKLCKACVLLEGLNRGMPKLGIGRVRGEDGRRRQSKQANDASSLHRKQSGTLEF